MLPQNLRIGVDTRSDQKVFIQTEEYYSLFNFISFQVLPPLSPVGLLTTQQSPGVFKCSAFKRGIKKSQ